MNWSMISGGPFVGAATLIISKALKINTIESLALTMCCCALWCIMLDAIIRRTK
jgi:hypothetical protein